MLELSALLFENRFWRRRFCFPKVMLTQTCLFEIDFLAPETEKDKEQTPGFDSQNVSTTCWDRTYPCSARSGISDSILFRRLEPFRQVRYIFRDYRASVDNFNAVSIPIT